MTCHRWYSYPSEGLLSRYPGRNWTVRCRCCGLALAGCRGFEGEAIEIDWEPGGAWFGTFHD